VLPRLLDVVQALPYFFHDAQGYVQWIVTVDGVVV
jgi:hypothetical protein